MKFFVKQLTSTKVAVEPLCGSALPFAGDKADAGTAARTVTMKVQQSEGSPRYIEFALKRPDGQPNGMIATFTQR